MSPGSSPAAEKGRPRGGPLFFLLVLGVGAAACGGGGGPQGPGPGGAAAVARPLEIYQDLGLATGPENFPAVAGFATLAGPGDSTLAIFGLSIPNEALRFQREATGFRADYTVSVAFRQDTVVAARIERREVVRVQTFAQTERIEESVVFSDGATLAPGEYVVDTEVRDALSSRGMTSRDTLVVPRYGAGQVRASGPHVVYQVSGRLGREDRPELIPNPRLSVEYGGAPPRIYIEVYAAADPVPVDIRALDPEGAVVWEVTRTVELGDPLLRYLIMDIPAGALPLGRLTLEVVPREPAIGDRTTALLVTVSDQWVVANFSEVLGIVGYVASEAEMDSLQAAEGAERQALWERFWERRDPLPATPINEFRESFFERVRTATVQFREPGSPGWRTDRGEVYIVLGPPVSTQEIPVDRSDVTQRAGTALQWLYDDVPGGRLVLTFVDQTGFGRFELTSSSRSAYRSAAERQRERITGER